MSVYPFDKTGQLLAGDEVQIIAPAAAAAIVRFAPAVEVAPVGAPLVLRIQNASGASPPAYIEATIAAGSKVSTAQVGTVPTTSGQTLYVRIVSGPTGGSAASYLNGYFETDLPLALGSPLASVSDLKSFLQIVPATWDTQLESIIAGITARFEKFTRRRLTMIAVGETLSIEQSDVWLVLREWPVVSVTDLLFDGVTVSASTYELDRANGRLYYASGFPMGVLNVSVLYFAGEVAIPADLNRAALEQAAVEWRKTEPGGGRVGLVSASREASGSQGYKDSGFLPSVESVLLQYRRMYT